MMQIEYKKDIEDLDDVKDAIFESILTGISVCEQRNLPSFSAEFEFYGAEIKMIISLKDFKTQ